MWKTMTTMSAGHYEDRTFGEFLISQRKSELPDSPLLKVYIFRGKILVKSNSGSDLIISNKKRENWRQE